MSSKKQTHRLTGCSQKPRCLLVKGRQLVAAKSCSPARTLELASSASMAPMQSLELKRYTRRSIHTSSHSPCLDRPAPAPAPARWCRP
ncbi:hypothetical protein [Cyanobium sp. A2C-AMD]|uniref:hypothetical protein n=1 Tax=Cyanobium sp. A2C-AMD TaxID=2823695 RepID=UPI0020CE71C7|nr:hypothetical protein [Cyanobium sp. A2C-AMD]